MLDIQRRWYRLRVERNRDITEREIGRGLNKSRDSGEREVWRVRGGERGVDIDYLLIRILARNYFFIISLYRFHTMLYYCYYYHIFYFAIFSSRDLGPRRYSLGGR